MKLVRVPDSIRDLSDRELRGQKELRGLGHAILDQILLRALVDPFFKQLQQLVPVDIASSCNGFHGDVVHKVFLDIQKCRLQIVV